MKYRYGALVFALAGVAFLVAGCARREAIERYNKAVRFVEARQYPDAIIQLEAALKLRPNFPEAHNTLGYVLNVNGKFDEAIEHFRQAAENTKFKQRALAYVNLGAAYTNARQYDRAEEALKSALELTEGAGTYYALAQIHATQGENDLALDALTKALALESQRVYELDRDPVFDNLRDMPKYKALITKYWK
jgi:Tfp pilus assembly protein PilF